MNFGILEVALLLATFSATFCIACLIYVYKKEQEYKDKNDNYARIFNRVSEELYTIKKALNALSQNATQKPVINQQDIENKNKRQTIALINDIVPPIVESIQKIDETFRVFESQTNDRMGQIERQLGHYPTAQKTNNTATINHAQIANLYRQGQSIGEISTQLGIPRSQVELVINMNTST